MQSKRLQSFHHWLSHVIIIKLHLSNIFRFLFHEWKGRFLVCDSDANARHKERVKMGERRRRDEGCVREGYASTRRWPLQTGRTSLRVSLSQTNGLRLFEAVFHRNLLFIIPPGWDDIGPCLLVVALMSLIAPYRFAPPVNPNRQPLTITGVDKSWSKSLSLSLSLS